MQALHAQKRKGNKMLIALIAVSALFAFSLVKATYVFQKYRPKFNALLDSKDEAMRNATTLIIKESLSFFSIYRIMFSDNGAESPNNLSENEKRDMDFLAKSYLHINFTAYWYNYLIIVAVFGILAIFKRINLENLFNVKQRISNFERHISLKGASHL